MVSGVGESGKKGGRKKGGGGGSSLDSSEFGFGLLGVMVRVARFVSEGCCGRAQGGISDAFV